MAVPRSIETRRYYCVARQRLEDGQLLFSKLQRFPAAIYLAGYAVECILKAMILANLPDSAHPAFIRQEFRGSRAHDVAALRAILYQAGGPRFPGPVSRDLAFVSTWSVDLRYTPGKGDEEEAREFLEAVDRIVRFGEERLR